MTEGVILHIQLPLTKDIIKKLKAGDNVTLSGTLFTARDAAHKRMAETIKSGGSLPFLIDGATIYYAGPCPAAPGEVVGSCGPTTSCRMDSFAPELLNLGLLGMIGKGDRSSEVEDAIVKNGAVYFAAIGGAGALYASCITSVEVIAYDDLGTESVKKLTVSNMPVTVAIDSYGNNLYKNK